MSATFSGATASFRKSSRSTSSVCSRLSIPLAFWATGSLGLLYAVSTRSSTSASRTLAPGVRSSPLTTASTAAMAGSGSLRKIPNDKLYVSEPPPQWFGNKENDKGNPTWSNGNWLKSRFHFSFAEYNSHKNAQFGVLRVMNDDLVQPARGFGTHPHRDMEICTYIVRGHLTHQDNIGTKETLGKGSIQFMTAGTGVRHSEHNLDASSDLRFIQMWITPTQSGLSPNYGGAEGGARAEMRKNGWDHMVTSVGNSKADTPVKINQDANIYVSEIGAGKSVDLAIAKGRQAYMLCIEGDIKVKGGHGESSLVSHDAAEVYGDNALSVEAAKDSHVLVVEMKEDGRGGRKDI